MSPSSPSARSLATLSLFLMPILVLAVACSGGGGGGSSTPTDPGVPNVTGNASVQGQVSVVGGTSGGSSAGSGLGTTALGPAGGTTPVSLTAADQSGAGVTVRIQGTSLSTTADGAGNFSLGGVPQGNQVLIFETPQASAGVVLDAIQPHETIRISVRMNGANAEVTDLDRDGGDPDEGGEEEQEIDLSLQLSPDTWNLNYDHSAGTVVAFLRGQGFEDVLLDSIVLVGDDADAEPLDPVGTSRQGNHVQARFAKDEVLDILDEPENGSVHEVTLQFEVDGIEGVQEISTDVRIVGPDDDEGDDGEDEDEEELDDLSLQLSPSSWNLNYDGASGYVTAFIRGTGLDAIDTDSVELVGDDPDADPLPASTARLEGNHVRAQFPKSEVLDLLDEPEKGSTHTVVVRFTSGDGAEEHELEAEVKVVGKDK